MAKVALAGGGTGGHVYPALAIGEALARQGHEILYYGDAGRLEGRVAPERGLPFRAVQAMQYPRAGLLGRIRFGLSLALAILRTRRMLKADGVDLVLGVGGYISAPTVLAAATLGIPRAVHEANVVPGLANRLCARVAQHVLLTFEATRTRMPGAAPRTVVGVPVRTGLAGGDRDEALDHYGLAADRPVVLVVGGSLGAARLNELALALARTPDRGVSVLHLCGPRYEDDIRAAWEGALPEGYALVGYEDRMDRAYAAADLVVARAGSSTLAELGAVGLPSVLVPSPNVTENHQEGNARGLEAAGAAEVVVEQGFDVGRAVETVLTLVGDEERLSAMARASAGLARPDAAEEAAAILTGLLR